MKIIGFVEEKVKSSIINLENLKPYIVLTFTINSDRPYLCFFFLVDPDGVIRVQFEGRKREEKIFVGEEQGSIGTYPGKLKSGKWVLYFTNYGLIEDEREKKVPFSVEIETMDEIDHRDFTLIGEDRWVDYPPVKPGLRLNFNGDIKKSDEQRWYRGDFHAHTTLSDSHMTPKDAVEYCESNEIDFMFLTEHNLIHTGFEKSNTLFIPAIEVTLFKGHLLVYGLRDFINCFTYEKFDSDYMNHSIKLVKENGGLINVAHPMMVPWDWRFMETKLEDIDMMEIVNCPNWHTSESDNRKAIELIDILWGEGFKITGVGGSDNHLKPEEKCEGYTGPSLYADPSTYVFADGLSEGSIFEAVKNGRVYVSRGVKMDIDISSDRKNYLPGDEIEEDSFTYKIDINGNYENALKASLIINGKVKEEKLLKDKISFEFSILWEKKDYNWARVGIYDKNNRFVAYINPVYRGRKKTNLLIWKELLKVYYHIYEKL